MLLTTILAAASGIFSYFLPQTDLVLEVTVQKTEFHAGPYARYARKYLGVNARTVDETSFDISQVCISSAIEADLGESYTAQLSGEYADRLLQLTTQGLVCSTDSSLPGSTKWRFPLSSEGVFRGIPANLETESNTLVSAGAEVSRQTVIVEKTPEKKAQEVADMIFRIRENRYKILVGDTDATYSGEAMKAAVESLDALEQEYLKLFLGYSDVQTQTGTFEVVPNAGAAKQMYVAFRLSPENGLVGPDDMSGKPCFLELVPEKMPDLPDGQDVSKKIVYRIPAVCKVVLRNGADVLLESRLPVYQLGKRSFYPVK